MLNQMKVLQDSILWIEMQAMQDSIRTGGDLSSFGITNDRIMERYNQWSETRPEDSFQIENARMEYMRVQEEMRRDVNSLRERGRLASHRKLCRRVAAEHIITFVYIASQIMIMQIVLVSIFGTGLSPVVFSIPTAILLIWDFKQLYNLTWKNSIFRFVVYMCGYTVLIYSVLYFLFSMGNYLLYRSYL